MGNVLITGGSGFIGSCFKAHLKGKGIDFLAPASEEFDVLKLEDIDQWKDRDINHVIHFAGRTFVPDSWEKPEEFFAVNTYGTLNVIKLCRVLGAKMTYISAYVYGQPKSNPISEDARVNPNNPYAESKYMAEELCRFFCGHFRMDITVLRLFNVYGPNQREDFLIPSIISQVLDGGDVVRVQNLDPRRDYIFIDDVCRAVEMSLYKTKGYQLYNIGSGRSFSVGEVIEAAQKAAGTKKRISSENSVRRNELNDVVADISRIGCEWGWYPEVSLEQGLARCMEV